MNDISTMSVYELFAVALYVELLVSPVIGVLIIAIMDALNE